MKEYEEFGEMEYLTNEPYTIKVKYHEGASRIGSDIHGVMCDLAASETVEMKQGEVKIIPLGVSNMPIARLCSFAARPATSDSMSSSVRLNSSQIRLIADILGIAPFRHLERASNRPRRAFVCC